jgi:hypothetical protein
MACYSWLTGAQAPPPPAKGNLMATEILAAGVLGLVAILVMGGLLALSATLLPRILRYGDTGPVARWSLGEPGSSGPNAQAPPPGEERTAPTLPPREPLASRLGTAPEEPLLAAAIGLALTLYQQQPVRILGVQAAGAGGSPWALSGRWQAMQARLNRQKR